MSSYGIGTRSYNRSVEAREMKKARAQATAKFEAQRVFETIEIRDSMCNCRSFRFAHNPERHQELLSDRDWRSFAGRRNQEIYQPRIS